MLTWAQARRTPARLVWYAACNPGVHTSPVTLGLGKELGVGDALARAGAATPLYLAANPTATAAAASGGFFVASTPASEPFVADEARVAAFMALLDEYTARFGAQ